MANVIVVGGGGVGLSIALAAAGRGLSVVLVAEHRAGEAFPAAAGILAPPSLEMVDRSAAGPEHAFAVAARDRYPSYLIELAEQSGVAVPINRLGLLHIVLDDAGAVEQAAMHIPGTTWLDRAALAALEPSLAHAAGARLFPEDGAVDNVVLLRALEMGVARSARIRQLSGPARGIRIEPNAIACEIGGEWVSAEQLVLAAGAWSPLIEGLPRPLPVEPLRGQMISLAASPVRHVVYGHDGYLVPRGDMTLVGATMEHAAFDVSTTAEGVAGLRAAAAKLCPALAGLPVAKAWAGLRPVSPDFLPIIGRDPDSPSLIYACGHSRNGVLMAPLTADCVAALLVGETPPASLAAFGIERFELTVDAATTG
ncbi:MAG TPA: FAD-dependent oxidoreductase [Gemmatimonadaceae bacterium]|nr:FAD-dependent oxidoreductase [Gemmatimonadaceae bacterium]